MAKSGDELGDDDDIRRSVGRQLVNWGMALASLAIIGGWAYTGIYQLEPGESAVILWLGERDRIVVDPGLKWHVPAPIETLEIVNVAEIRERAFGILARSPAPAVSPEAPDARGADTATDESARTPFGNAMQTADSNIVNLGYVLQYQIDDAFAYLYGIKDSEQTLFDATRASVREVVGRMKVDDVLSTRRSEIELMAGEILRARLASYYEHVDAGSAFDVVAIRLQVVQPPQQVQNAFDDVVSAQQDERRAVSAAEGDIEEILERANAEVIELESRAEGYKQAKILEARGRAARFEALLAEYQRAPEVTLRRLYLETMEDVLPEVDKVIIEPGSVALLPLLPSALTPLAAPHPPPAVSAGPDVSDGAPAAGEGER